MEVPEEAAPAFVKTDLTYPPKVIGDPDAKPLIVESIKIVRTDPIHQRPIP
jgi:hypothetical protein